MTPLFNLLYERWIPCVMQDGAPAEKGVREVLTEAHGIRDVDSPSPIVTASLYRLLLAVVHRVFAPKTMEEWQALLTKGSFDEKALRQYFEQWEDRFYLIHDKYPFYQSLDKELLEQKILPCASLFQELASGNNPLLFDHTLEQSSGMISFAEAARGLVATQADSLGGGVSKPFNLSHAPGVLGVLNIVVGKTLFHTLCLNTISDEMNTFPDDEESKPCWERGIQKSGKKRPPKGYLDYLTWQSRRIKLCPDETGIAGIRRLQGDALPETMHQDPLMAYQRRKQDEPYRALRFQTDRAAWRDAHVLLAYKGEMSRRTLALEQAMSLEAADEVSCLRVLGLCNDQAKTLFWRDETISIPGLLVSGPSNAVAASAILERLVYLAEAGARALNNALLVLASILVSPGQDKPEGRMPDMKTVTPVKSGISTEGAYWAALQPLFHEAAQSIGDDDGALLEQWSNTVEREARRAFLVATSHLDNSARSLKAASRGESALAGQIRKQLQPR